MSKQERGSPSPSSPSSSKLPKFLQKSSRDRSRSMVDPAASSSTIASSSSFGSNPDSPPNHNPVRRKNSKKLFGKGERRRQSQDVVDIHQAAGPRPEFEHTQGGEDAEDEHPVIVEPVAIPRPRTHSERPLSDNYPLNFYPSTSAGPRITDLPSRLSGWFQHTFSTSSTDLTLPSLLSQQHIAASTSPKGKSSALLTAAKHGKGHLDKAMRYLLDSDAAPDKCPDPIWILGVEHPGYDPSQEYLGQPPNVTRRGSVESRKSSSIQSSPTSSPRQQYAETSFLSQSQPPSASSNKDPSRHWPPVFYSDFTSRIWLTYRSQFFPIRDTSLEELDMEVGDTMVVASSPPVKKWNWPLGGEKGWSSDAGWGCMLRTGQSLLANTLVHLHLGRDWRKPPYPVHTADYATYVQILTWFLDDPSPLCPFSVHRMALVGKSLGVKVGQWFGPSTAAGAIKTLVHAFPEAGLGIYVASDGGTIYESEVLATSHGVYSSPRRAYRRSWGDRAVLVLIGHRLGLDRVNPIYYDTLKVLYTWPQSVGIAGGRPSSSYYFVGSQADNLFYLDPHHARPAVPLRPPPRAHPHSPQSNREQSPPASNHSRQTSPEPNSSSDRERDTQQHHGHHHKQPRTPHRHVRSPTSPPPPAGRTSTGSSYSHRGVISPSPLQHQLSSSTTSSNYHSTGSSQSHSRWQSSSGALGGNGGVGGDFVEFGSTSGASLSDLDPMQRHYVSAYSAAELKTFHCDRVRKMALSGLDPSMLMGFLCKDENDWNDFKARVAELNSKHKATVISLQDEPPNWPSDSEMGLESISEPDIDLPEEDDLLDDGSSSDMRHSPSGCEGSSPDTSVSVPRGHGAAPSTSSKSEAETEEDPIDPITPGVGKTSFDMVNVEEVSSNMKELKISVRSLGPDDSLDFEDDDDDDEEWVDPSEFTPQTPSPSWTNSPIPSMDSAPVYHSQDQLQAHPVQATRSSTSSKSRESSHSSGTKHRKKKTSRTTSSGHVSRTGSHSQPPQQEQYPFPAAFPGDEEYMKEKRVPQMRTAKARDGGRTQSGGVRGVPTEDLDDF